MTIAVHQPSNSLIVTAPDQLFAEVQSLVEVIDARSAQTVEFVSPGNSAYLLDAMFGGSDRPAARAKSGGSSSSSRNGRAEASRGSGESRFQSMLQEKYGR